MLRSSETVKRAGLTSLAVNLLLVFIKGFIGVAAGSRALVADAVHTLSDLSTDIAVIVGVKFWYRPPDESHPMGHRGIETAVSMFIGIMLVVAGAGIGYDAVRSMGRDTASPPGLLAAFAALLSVISKEILYRWTLKKSRETGSAALTANALHNRSDAFSSIPVLVAIGASQVSPELAFLDPLAGTVVSVFVIISGWNVLKPGIAQMTNTAPPAMTVEKIRLAALSVDGVMGLHRLRARMQAGGIFVDLHLQIDGETPVIKAFLASKEVEKKILAVDPLIRDVIARIEPWAPCGDADDCLKGI